MPWARGKSPSRGPVVHCRGGGVPAIHSNRWRPDLRIMAEGNGCRDTTVCRAVSAAARFKCPEKRSRRKMLIGYAGRSSRSMYSSNGTKGSGKVVRCLEPMVT